MPNRSSLALAALAASASCAAPSTVNRGSARSVDLVVAAVTDVHGRLRGWNYESNRPDLVRGLSRAATIVDSVRAADPGRVVLLDAGDLLQGNSLTWVAARVAPAGAVHPVIAAMNAMHFDAAAIGNHEINYGVPFLEATIRQATFPFLATNAYRPDGTHAFRRWTMVEREGVRIGIVGASTPGSMVWDRDHLAGRIVLRDIVSEVRSAVADVRAAGADIVLVTLHSGLAGASSYDTVATSVPSENVAARVAREVPGIEVVLYGHSHQEVADTVINGVLLMQPKNWATSVAIAHLALERTADRWQVRARHSALVQAAGHAESAAVLAATQAAHDATVAWVTTAMGTTPVTWRSDSARVVDTPLIDFVLETMRRAAGADLASTAAFSLDAFIDAGPITAARLQALYPYDNTLRAVRITGQQLREYLEQSARYFRSDATGRVTIDPSIPGYNFDILSGVDYTLDVSRPMGARVTRLEFHGRPVDPTQTFTLALNNYRQTGGGGYGMLAHAPVVYDRQQEIRQLLIDEVRRRGTLRPEDYFTANWRLEPASAVAALYAQMHRLDRAEARATSPRPLDPPGRLPRPATRLRVIATNDFHGALEPRPDMTGRLRGGGAYLATAIHRAADGCAPPACELILLDGGDEFQGTPASNLAFGRPVVAMFNTLGYAAGAIGNHEFDWGQDTLRARMREAHYAILAANVRDALGYPVPWIRADTLVRRGALAIGVVGVATVSTPRTTRAANVADLRFLDPAPIVDSLTRTLRARGADYVIVVAHAGAYCDRTGHADCAGEIVDFARKLTEPVDAIVSGHTHSLVDTDVGGVPVVQARSSGTALAVIDLGPVGTTHAVRDVLPDSLTPDATVATIVRDAVAHVAPIVDRPVAVIARDLNRVGNEYPLGDLIADAIRAEGGGDVAVTNNGGIRANLRAGPATYGALFEIQPFANALNRLTVDGATLRRYLEKLVSRRPNVHISGLTVTYDTTAAVGARIRSVRMRDGRALRDDGTYRLVLNDFLATGGDGLGLAGSARRTEVLPLVDLDALVAWLRRAPQPVQGPTDLRFIATGAAR
jgi:2',3'-cyclic-nucleotide 2'-phosphodiesterase (5'-nucleotidase family)